MTPIFTRYILPTIVGGTAFWGCFAVVRIMVSSDYGGKSVGFLTLLAPLTTWVTMYLWYVRILERNHSGVIPALCIGMLGPLLGTWIYSLFAVTIPSLANAPAMQGFGDYLEEIVLTLVVAPLSTLTYTGMLGALALNLIASPVIGVWLSRKRPEGGP